MIRKVPLSTQYGHRVKLLLRLLVHWYKLARSPFGQSNKYQTRRTLYVGKKPEMLPQQELRLTSSETSHLDTRMLVVSSTFPPRTSCSFQRGAFADRASFSADENEITASFSESASFMVRFVLDLIAELWRETRCSSRKYMGLARWSLIRKMLMAGIEKL
jgi:hypothetical protein